MPLTDNLKIIGCYAQTELGHGSNVPGLETTATYDKATDEFVLNTPSVSAAKYWIGGLGMHSTHCVILCQLVVDDYTYGSLPFLLPVRDPKTWEPLPGIKVGDLGEKLGYNQIDNGWMTLENVRIPRFNMFARFCELDREGNFELKGDIRMTYQIMLQTRLMLMYLSAHTLLYGITMVTRYAVCRRQFANQKGSKKERKLLDYQSHMLQLAPVLAKAYVQQIVSVYVDDLVEASDAQIK